MGLLRIERICDLPEDLLLGILLLLPPKDAVATGILSKRWRYLWKMLHKLTFKDDDQGSESFVWFVDKTLQHHNAPKLVSLVVELGSRCSPVDVDVTKWVDKAVNHGVKDLVFNLLWTVEGEPTSFLPESLYTCDSLVSLTLSNQILVDVSFQASLPSLSYLKLVNVFYKDEESLVRLLSSCPVLKELRVERGYKDDGLTNFIVKVPSLKKFVYETPIRSTMDMPPEEGEEHHIGSLVIDSPGLKNLKLTDYRGRWGDYCTLMDNFHCLDNVASTAIANHDNEKFLRCFTSARRLNLYLSESMVACGCCNTVKFPRLTDLVINALTVYWLEPLMFLLHNSPKLKTLTIYTTGCPQCTWNQPSTVPQCLSSHLEIVQWVAYKGKEDEKQLMKYILANSKCLKRVEMSFIAKCDIKEWQKELEAMPRISASSRFLYCNPVLNWSSS